VKLVILDRDGVINEDSDAYIKTPDEWIPVPGSLNAISRLTSAGFTIAVATNQSGVARGYYSLSTLYSIHEKMLSLVTAHGGKIDQIFFCPHSPDENCDCRKPKSGLFQQIQRHYQQSLNGIPAIGDSLRDLEAAKTLGCSPILVLTGKGIRTLTELNPLDHIPIFDNLSAAVDSILSGSSWSQYAP